ncbi:MAG: 6-phosphogluconolactonase [Sphingomonadaceae bacterium]
MIEAEWWDYEDMDELADAVAGDVAFVIESAIDARGSAVIALAGGKTPQPILAKLAEHKLNWKKVMIVPTDERLVPLDNPLSNAAMLAKIFLPKGARVIPISTEKADDYHLAGSAAAARLDDLHWPLDLVWLGMGEDGHTASIFTGPDYEDALNTPAARKAIGVMPDPLPPEAPVARVTLTRASIQAAKTLTIVVTGAKKRALLEKAIEEGDSSSLPIGRVLAGLETPVDIHWCA